MQLEPGVYESLITEAIRIKLQEMKNDGYYVATDKLDSADSSLFFAEYLAKTVSAILKDCCNNDDEEGLSTIEAQIKRINQIFLFIKNEWQVDTTLDELVQGNEFLRGVYKSIGCTEAQLKAKAAIHPVSGYRVSNLFTGSTRDISIDQEIIRDIQTADKIDLMVSFVRFTGLRLIIDALQQFVRREDSRLRVITTTYMGVSDTKAIQRLFKLKDDGNVEIKVSYNTGQERLHAKAYLFKRHNGLHTAYIGSSNLSQSAMTKGLEWNLRVTSIENPHILEKAQATFDYYWNNENFESITDEADIARFNEAIYYEKNKKLLGADSGNQSDEKPIYVRFERKTHQIKVLDQLHYERTVVGSYRNLIIAATGTGKTAISAFDFKDFNKVFKAEHHRPARLLFVVHRDQILRQALSTYRSVLVDGNFGELWVGQSRPSAGSDLSQLFVSIQTLTANLELFQKMGPDYYDYVVIDEAHHSQAGSYRILFELFHPSIFIGLTATPERMDGKVIKSDFNNRYAAEIRLYDALNQQLLCPFQYFCVSDDSVNLAHITFRGDKYDTNELADTLSTQARMQIIDQALERYITNPYCCKAVCFCTNIKHAEFTAEMLNKKYKAVSLTSKNKSEQSKLIAQLIQGDIQYLCVADILNEGFDIPEIDTILFLRPTESLTIFLQQLGRGLRTADGKTELTVLDFVAQANKLYDYGSRFRALTGGSEKNVQDGIKNGFTLLPRGCSIEMEKMAQQYILETVKASVFNKNRLLRELSSFHYNTGKELTITNFLTYLSLDIRVIYKNGGWNALKRYAGLLSDTPDKVQLQVENSLYQLLHINSSSYFQQLKQLLSADFCKEELAVLPDKYITMLYYALFNAKLKDVNKKCGTDFISMRHALEFLFQYPTLKAEIAELVDYQLAHACQITQTLEVDDSFSFDLYRCYSRDEIYINFTGDVSRGSIAGLANDKEKKVQLLFCTINKSDKEFSQQTMYEDYAKDAYNFHWQSQNNTRADSEAGRLYTEQEKNGWRFILFVRDTKKDSFGFTNSFYCLGFMKFDTSFGERPMSIDWKMEQPIPGIILEKAMVG